MSKKLLVFLLFAGFVSAIAMMPANEEGVVKYARFHDPSTLAAASHRMTQLLDSGQYFLTPQNCAGCHGHDLLGLANVDGLGNDVNLFDAWQTSMMGLAAVDPLWRAKVRQEILIDSTHTNELQTFCTRCHAPMGHYTALYHGMPFYTLANVDTDSLALAGVGCGSCHSIGPNGLGTTFTGIIPYDTSRVEYGPFDNPFVGPMQLYIGLTPTKGLHMNEGILCSPCHTLISNSVDLNGIPTGTSFVEQATFHEWENSVFPGQDVKCQTCHMPQIEDPIKIANGYTALLARSPFNKHSFAGSNYFMVNLIKQNKNSLGVTASDKNFDSTLAVTTRQLLYNSDSLKLVVDTVMDDTLFIRVAVFNKTGHKFPSGYPSRRAVLRCLAIKANGDTLFGSGLFDSTMEVQNIDSVFEPHYDVITHPDQIQIYEMVPGDVNGNKTTILERAYAPIKDNRIPPLGFTTTFSTYDTCKIVGAALTDPDFNKIGTTEGSGMDIVHYHIALNGYTGLLKLFTGIYYQLLSPGWLKEMFTHSAAEIDTFKAMYNSADKEPILTGADSVVNLNITTGIWQTPNASLSVGPNPTSDGWIRINLVSSQLKEIELYDLNGKRAAVKMIPNGANNYKLHLPDEPGIWILRIRTQVGEVVRKIIRL